MPFSGLRSVIAARWIVYALALAGPAVIAAAPVCTIGSHIAFAEDSGSADTSGHPEINVASTKAVAASKLFVAQTRDVYKTGDAPRQTDPAVGKLLDAVFDVSILQRTHVSEADGDAIAEWLLAAVHVGTVYVGAGTGVTSLSAMAHDTKAREQSDHNVAAYAPEVGRYMDSEIVLETALMGTVLKGGPEPDDAMLRKVYTKMRFGLQVTVSSVLKTLALPGVDYEWRLARVAVLDASASKIARLLDSGMCAQLHKTVSQVSTKVVDSRVTEKLAAFDEKLTCSNG